MMVTQISDRWVFFHRALEAPALVHCCCVPGTKVEEVEGGAVFIKTLNLHYRIEFVDKLWQTLTQWTFLEVRTPDAQGNVSLEGTLLSMLRAHDPKTVVIEHRSGSVLV